jgi:YgiT-type zinc finger domain-containing protein
MICLICRRTETIHALTSIIFERGEIKIEVNQVPAFICPNCGETYVDEDVAVRLLARAEEMSLAGKLNAVAEYEFF